MSGLRAPENCAVCGASIPPNSKACPECGADERTGWREQSIYDGLDLPDEDDSETDSKRPRSGVKVAWQIVGVALLVILVILALRGRL